jgi:outer membrane protein assembly factor BamB
MITGVPILVLAGLAGASSAAAEPPAADRFWPQWRGPLATGAAPHARPPVEWSETKNVRWKVEVPGRGVSSPIVWRDLVIVTAAVPIAKALPRPSPPPPREGFAHPAVSLPGSAQAFEVLAYGRADGKLRWRRAVREEFPHEGTHKDGTFASASAATDGERVYAFFGSRGLYALDMDGRVVWEKDLGDMTVKLGFGEGASPALHGDRLVLTWDHEGESFLVAFDARTGRELWRTPRAEKTTWATPLVVVQGKPQVVTAASNRVRAYDLQDGALVWEAPGLTPNAIPTPVHGDGLLYLTSGFRGNALMAVKVAEAKGDLGAGPAIAWRYDQDTPYVPSPLLYAGGLYFLKGNSGILTRLDARTGEKQFTERVATLQNVYASPVAADGRVYVVDRDGATAVLKAGPALQVLAVNTLEDGFDASPAVVDGELYLRGRRHLYAIAETTSAPRAQAAPSDPFWSGLQSLCGKAFAGRVVAGTEASDEAIRKERLVMHVRTCAPSEVRVPFHVGADRSRTWVITPAGSGLRLKHEHRHRDGSEDQVTQYGGDTRAADPPLWREFFADAHTAALLPAAAENVWTLALEPGKTFSYALRREKQGRRFRVEFDLTREVPPPPAPW